jgi:predicted DNA-binding antitoxin AbrB/MazE fold protein
MTTLRAQFDGKVLIPLDPVNLPQGRVLEIQVREADDAPPGSRAALLKLMEAPRRAAPEDVDELERLIERAKLPIHHRSALGGRGE